MAYGFRAINSIDGVVQIDDETPNYQLHSIVAAASFATASGFPPNSLFAFQPPDAMSQHSPDESMSGRCLIFAPLTDISHVPSGFGLLTRNASNQLCCSTDRPMLVIVDYVEWSGSGGTLVKTYTPGREYAVIVIAERIYERGESSHTGDMGEGEEIWDSTISLGAIKYSAINHVVTFSVDEWTRETWTSYETGNNSGIFIPERAPNGYIIGDGSVAIRALIVDVTGL